MCCEGAALYHREVYAALNGTETTMLSSCGLYSTCFYCGCVASVSLPTVICPVKSTSEASLTCSRQATLAAVSAVRLRE